MNDQLYKIRARPKLKSPVLLASWPGVGNVAIIVASYLKDKLGFKELGEIKSQSFFNPVGVLVRDNVVEAPQFPDNRFFYWKNPGDGNDVILFMGEDQPAMQSYDLANVILDVAEKFKVESVYTCAAAVTRIHHTEQSRVWGVGTSYVVAEKLREYNLTEKANLQIAGLNGLLLGVAKERSINGVCLLGEVPSYASRMHNPMAALAVLQALTVILHIDIDMTDLALLATETREKMKQAAAEAMGQYIDYLTQPIWEQGESDEDEYDEEDEED